MVEKVLRYYHRFSLFDTILHVMDTQPASHVAVAYIPSLLRRTGKNGYGLFIFITYANKK